MNHPDRMKVNFTLLLQPGTWFPTATLGGNETLQQELERYISYFRMPNYQKVLGRRPLVFTFGQAFTNVTLHALATLRTMTKTALGVEPYIASMNGGHRRSTAPNPDLSLGCGSHMTWMPFVPQPPMLQRSTRCLRTSTAAAHPTALRTSPASRRRRSRSGRHGRRQAVRALPSPAGGTLGLQRD